MKTLCKIAAVAIALLAAVGLSSCDKGSDNEKKELTFGITLSDILSTGATVAITPSDLNAGYYFDALTDEAYKNVADMGFQAFIESEINRRIEAGVASREQALEKMLSKGATTYPFASLSPQTNYVLVVFGVSATGEVTTAPFTQEFSTPAVDPSKNELTISVSNIANNGADYAIKASVAADQYFADIWSKSLVDELGDEKFMEYCIEYNGFMMQYLCTAGDFELENEHVCQPGRDYYVVAFGYDEGYPTTKLFKKEFTTVGGDPTACTFKFTYPSIEATTATIKVTPSDKQVVYIWDVIDVARFNEFKAATTGKTDKETLAYILNGLIEEGMATENIKRQQAVEAMGRWSGYTTSDPEGYDQEKISGLTANTDYIVWAVSVDAVGTPQGEFAFEQFKTAE